MIPVNWPDQTLQALQYLRSRPSLAGIVFTRTKQSGKPLQVVIDTEYQRLETPISRACTVLLESWCERENGTADTPESFRIMSLVLYELQRAPIELTSVVGFESPIGPRVVKDDSGFEYHEGSLIWVVTS
ncbi:hypothetical protein QBL02_13030 [Leucobacter sp. UT-8R-CII-1-4]|uniref:hypothetical protein n=1 Tax=Leucobacter sp. UT-8R-CII-1-4 TaxID=3040075 RepID=UPI0024A83863|nr:hypothetical protein [Leucobacter sp. UT-8R-CII-1-4]MDI6024464.1 hypothetical protein [Leucobacter sp. UT-8R-CII-1-4]